MGKIKHNSKRLNVFVVALLLPFLLLQIYTCYSFSTKNNHINYVVVTKEVEEVDNTKEDLIKDAQNKVNEEIKKYNNNDIVGILSIPGTGINEPILRGRDNDYYLNHNPYGEYQAEGSVYEDYRTNLHDRKVLIFGHSSPNWNVPFNELERYYEKSFYDNHKYIDIYSLEGINTYQVFSVHVETSDFSYMNLHISEDTYNNNLKKYIDRSLYDTQVTVKENDEIVILQTCSNKAEYQVYKKKYLLVIAKKIREVK